VPRLDACGRCLLMGLVEEAVEEGDRHRLHPFRREIVERRVDVSEHEGRMLAAVLVDTTANAPAQIAWH
jgi:hypothetical protein